MRASLQKHRESVYVPVSLETPVNGLPSDQGTRADRWRRIESLCHAALARPAGERAAFLAETCGDDATLRAEVESLLAGAESAPAFLENLMDGVSSAPLVGRQLGAYRIDASIGAGGMGEVYRAKDTRLGRDVAVKILPAVFTTDPQRRARFEREARAIAALKHPNICTIYDVGHDQGIDFLVMELVDGESLAERLAKGPLPVDEALAHAIQIGDALDKAHGQGIIHRDLKPGNVMLARKGSGTSRGRQAKLLDFGLARIMPSGVGAGEAPTDISPMTEAGAILGTMQYMAPEQIEAQPADARTDIFAFGAVLYEMLTGRRAFEGATQAGVMAAILREEPPPVHPREIGRIVRRCLAKDPLRRYQSARDLLNDLEEVEESSRTVGVDDKSIVSTRAQRRTPRRAAGWVGIAVLIAAVATAAYLGRPRPGAAPSYRPLTFQRGVITGARFSPDGQTVYYSAAFDAGPPRVYMTRLEGTGSVPIAGLPPATLLSVSSKGELAVLLTEERAPMISSGTLARASAVGGSPRPLYEGVVDADWAPDGQLAVLRANGNLEFPYGRVLVPSVPVWPRMSPGGNRIAYIGDHGIQVADLEGRSVLNYSFEWAFGLAWRPDGREIWFTGDTGGGGAERVLYALSLSGQRRVVAAAPGAMTIYDIAKDGRRVLLSTGAGWWGIQAGRSDGPAESTLDLNGRTDIAGLSGDGSQVLLNENENAGRGLYLRSTDGSTSFKLSDDYGLGLSPDARWALTWRRDDPAHLFLVSTGTEAPQEIEFDPRLSKRGSARWSDDGRKIFIALFPEKGNDDTLRIYTLDPPKTWRPVTPSGVDAAFAVSPDGRSIAARDREGHLSIFPVDGGEPRTIVEERGRPIQWSSDGRWLYLARMESFRARVYRRELDTGRVESWRDLGPSDPAGVTTFGAIFISRAGLAYAYNFSRVLGVLYLAEGLK
jgi:eukaryotic-like serine/threonine-protein kinase